MRRGGLKLQGRLAGLYVGPLVETCIKTHAQPRLLAHACGEMNDRGCLRLGSEAQRAQVVAGLGLAACLAQLDAVHSG